MPNVCPYYQRAHPFLGDLCNAVKYYFVFRVFRVFRGSKISVRLCLNSPAGPCSYCLFAFYPVILIFAF